MLISILNQTRLFDTLLKYKPRQRYTYSMLGVSVDHILKKQNKKQPSRLKLHEFRTRYGFYLISRTFVQYLGNKYSFLQDILTLWTVLEKNVGIPENKNTIACVLL